MNLKKGDKISVILMKRTERGKRMAIKTHIKNGKLEKIRRCMKDGLKEYGVDANVKWKRSGVLGKYWFYAISRNFEKWNHSERQDVVWRILKNNLETPDLVKITMVFTWTEREEKGDFR